MKFMTIRRAKFFWRARFYFLSAIFFGFLLLILTSFCLQGLTYGQAEEKPLPSLSLVGVIISGNASSSLAILKNGASGRTVTLRVGENISGLTLVQVFENRVILQKENQTFQIFLGRGNLVKAQEVPPRNPVEPAPLPKEDDSKSEGSNSNMAKKEFVREDVLKRLEAEWPVIVNETRFVPNIVEGKTSGFKITNLPEKTILSDMGILKNDIIKGINGVELNDMDTIFSLYNQLKDESRFEVSMERNGKSLRILYVLK